MAYARVPLTLSGYMYLSSYPIIFMGGA